jgi:haloacetate dehalogenase
VEDYRAAATIDLEHDRQSRELGVLITLPKLYVISGNLGHVKDASKSWEPFISTSTELVGIGLDSGHYVVEERPEEVLEAIIRMMEDK